MVQLIGLPGGITPPGHERRVFRMVIIIGAVLIVAALIFMFWQKFPAEHPVQHFPVVAQRIAAFPKIQDTRSQLDARIS